MIWILYACTTALCESIKDVLGKRSLLHLNEYLVSWSLWIVAFLIFGSIILLTGIPHLGEPYWTALLIGGPLNILATIFYMKAIKHTDLSLTVPLVTFTPLFLLITSPLIVGELPDLSGLLGVLLIVLGSYLLQINTRRQGILTPFKSLLKQQGPRYMLLVAFIWSISASIDKIGVQSSTPIFWVFSVSTMVTILLIPFLLIQKKHQQTPTTPTSSWSTIKILMPIGIVYAIVLYTQMTAISLSLVSYVISIKRMSVIFSVVWGALIFKETGIKERLIGVIIMIAGVLCITLI